MALNDTKLKRYKRTRNVEMEREHDGTIFESIGPVSQQDLAEPPIRRFAVILLTFLDVSFEGDPLVDDFSSLRKIGEFLQEHRKLLPIMVTCIEKKDFSDLRDLEIFRPKRDPMAAIERLRNKHADLFARLSIRLESITHWKFDDVINNNADLYVSNSFDTPQTNESTANDANSAYNKRAKTTVPSDIDSIKTQLQMARTVNEERMDTDHAVSDLFIARQRYPTEFERVFGGDVPGAQVVVDDREYITLFNLHRCFMKDTVRVAKPLSFAFKAGTFSTYFIHPSLLYPLDENPTKLAYKEDRGWGFLMFITSNDRSGTFKYTPRNDWAVIHQQSFLPLVISEIISQKDESDENRMLIQAIALARAGQYLMNAASKATFFLVAIYLDDDLLARRYIVKPQNEKDSGVVPVSIAKETFNLAEGARASMFLLEMLNLASHMQELSNQFDEDKVKELLNLQSAAQDMVSLTTGEATAETERKSSNLGAAFGEGGGSGGDPSPFDSNEVREVLDQHGYAVGFTDAFHSNVALVIDQTGNDRPVEYLKFMKQGSKEFSILQYLAEIESPHNHAVRPIRSWDVQDGKMVSLPSCGVWITSLKNMTKYLRGVTRQLCEGVKFLHDNNVAHLDLKSHNIVIPSTYGRLTILDFNASIRLKKMTSKVTGRAGTEGYMAPEVGFEAYSPIRADLYSCGVVIEEICQEAEHSVDREILLAIASRLKDVDPYRRPMMSEILAWLDVYSSSENLPTPISHFG